MGKEAELPDNNRKAPSVRVGKFVGYMVTMACLFYVVRSLNARSDFLELGLLRDRWGLFLIGIALWILVNVLLGIGWKFVAATIGAEISLTRSIILSLRTQAAKYMPGNVFHLAGRVWLAKSEGITAKQAGFATASESAILILAAVLLGTPYLWGGGYTLLPITITFLIFSLSITKLRIPINLALSRLSLRVEEERLFSRTALASLAYIGVFIAQALLFILIAEIFAADERWRTLEALQISSLSWVAGFAVIGSPGGLGVREATISLFASNDIEKGQLLLIGAGIRLCSVTGDFLSLGLGLLLDRWNKRSIET